MIVAFIWGLAEASLFFIVPDVFLTFLACRSLRSALKATIAALAGALIGGAIMYEFGTRSAIEHVPGIHSTLIEFVHEQLARHGIAALLIGPLRGIPYKIYAVEWRASGGSLPLFLAVSIPARWLRFAGSVLVARGCANALARWTKRRPSREATVLAIFWSAFYVWYFFQFGW